ncbi:hypothetical protein [Brenneria izadpanahii]|nr:hypothetical protein [Brenneria izadpanahii]
MTGAKFGDKLIMAHGVKRQAPIFKLFPGARMKAANRQGAAAV